MADGRGAAEPEVLSGADRMWPQPSDAFEGCPSCDNAASVQASMPAGEVPIDELFLRARDAWARDLAAFLDGGIDPQRQDVRRGFLEVTTLEGVAATLDELEAMRRSTVNGCPVSARTRT